MVLNPPVVFVRLYQLIVRALRFVKDKAQEIFEWFMNKFVVWLCRYYMHGGYGC